MQVNLSGDYSLDILKELAEDLQEDMEAIPSVLGVDLTGGLEREVQVDVDLPKLKYYNLSFGDIIAAIQEENVTVPGGDITVGSKTSCFGFQGNIKPRLHLKTLLLNQREINQYIFVI